jgi:serine/threonine protein kinase
MKKQLKTTKIPSLILVDNFDSSVVYKFTDFYEYVGDLGAGSFGFVVSAIDIQTQDKVALKVLFEMY